MLTIKTYSSDVIENCIPLKVKIISGNSKMETQSTMHRRPSPLTWKTRSRFQAANIFWNSLTSIYGNTPYNLVLNCQFNFLGLYPKLKAELYLWLALYCKSFFKPTYNSTNGFTDYFNLWNRTIHKRWTCINDCRAFFITTTYKIRLIFYSCNYGDSIIFAGLK